MHGFCTSCFFFEVWLHHYKVTRFSIVKSLHYLLFSYLVQLNVQVGSNLQLIMIDYYCSTLYISPLDIAIRINITALNYQFVTSCSNASTSFAIDQDYMCNGPISVCGYLITGLNATDCLISCTNMTLPCPTAPSSLLRSEWHA